jgi:glycosyltransferase involved in cell wall biosynthesis
VNAAYSPGWVASLRVVRALFRFVPFIARLWHAAGRADLFHVMANSGWAWHLCAAPAVWIAKVRGVPVLVNYRGGNAESFFARSFLFVGPTLRAADELVVPSGFLQTVFSRFNLATQIVPNIIDAARFTPRRRARNVSESPHIVVTRNLEPIYDIATALRALAVVKHALPGVQMTVAGSGPERARLAELVDSLGVADNVTFTGKLENHGIEALYQQADVFLNPSLVDNMPISVLEALASGVPVVSTRVGGVPYIVEHDRTALLVPPGDAGAMADALLELLSNRAKREQLAHAGRDVVQQYTWPHVGPRLLGIYRRLSAGRLRNVAAPAE